jgi:hypothetical protein
MRLKSGNMITFKTYFFCLLAVLSAYSSFAQAPRKFYMRFGGNGYDVGYDVKQTLDNGYIITGSTSSFGQGNTDLYLVKLDSMGNRKFEKSFGNYNNEIGKSVLQLLDSSYVTVGYTNSTGFGGYDIFLLKTDKKGNLLWQKTIGGSDWDFAYSLQTTFDGGFVIAGTTYSFGYGNADGYVVKTDGNGDVVWTKTYGGQHDDEFKSIVQTSDGGFALTGYTKSYNDVDSGDVWVFKLDIMGDSVWSKYYGGSREDFGNSITQLQDSKVVVAGGTRSASSTNVLQTLIASYDATTGAQAYVYPDPGTVDEYYNCFTQGINGSMVGCGKTKNPVFGPQLLIDVYSSVFTYINFYSYTVGSNDELFAVSRTKDKGFVCIGTTQGTSPTLTDFLFIKIDSVGSYGVSITDIDELTVSNMGLKVFPNPATDRLTIDVADAADKQLSYKLINMEGQLISQGIVNYSQTDIDLNGTVNGLYFLQISGKNKPLSVFKISVLKN